MTEESKIKQRLKQLNKVNCKNLLTGEKLQVSKEEFELDNNLVGFNKGVKLSDDHKKAITKANKGWVNCKNNNGEHIRVTLEEFYSDNELVSYNKGKIISKSTREKMKVSKSNMSEETKLKMSSSKKGVKSNNRGLSDKQVDEIKKLLKGNNMSNAKIAEKIGCGPHIIGKIKKGFNYVS